MKQLVWPLLACLLLSGCKGGAKMEKTALNDTTFHTIQFVPKAEDMKQRMPVSRIATRVEYIPLETSDSILIGYIENMVVWKGRFYFYDRKNETLFCFGADGRFLHRIGRQGEGPQEYTSCKTFDIDPANGDVYINDSRSRRVCVYTADGQFKTRYEVPFWFNCLARQGKHIHYYIGCFPNKRFQEATYPTEYRLATTEDGKEWNCQLPFTYDPIYMEIPTLDSNFSFYRDTLLLTEDLSGEVFTVSPDGNVRPRYRIEFPENAYRPSFRVPIKDETAIKALKADKLTKVFSKVYETDRYVFFNYAHQVIGMALLDKQTGKVENLGFMPVDDYNNIRLSSVFRHVDSTHIYQTVSAEILLNPDRKPASEELAERISRLTPDDNPVIVKITLKGKQD